MRWWTRQLPVSKIDILWLELESAAVTAGRKLTVLMLQSADE